MMTPSDICRVGLVIDIAGTTTLVSGAMLDCLRAHHNIGCRLRRAFGLVSVATFGDERGKR